MGVGVGVLRGASGVINVEIERLRITGGAKQGVVECAGRLPMSVSHSRMATMLVLLLSLPAISQDVRRDPVAVTIVPTEATVHVGQKQIFRATVKGTEGIRIQWAVREPDGGRITKQGVYSAPRKVGRYHVVATTERDSSARAEALVTVVTEYDPPDSRKKY